MARKPNVVLVMTDDQGYADLGCTGNPWIHTPNIDAFSRQAVVFNHFHVSPLCTPTRGALLSGHNPLRNGAWATCWGRSILRKDELTMADVFRANGYRTGMFGKWHLGDNYPYRPEDRGFDEVVAHKGGGVGQTPDFWGNNYFDDTYFHNGAPVAHEGYCTDVWFDEALRFIEDHREQPFFCYLATNAPHSPYLVAERYTALYRDNRDIPEPAFYGMITNIDENWGRLVQRLDQLGLAEDTILIFMTDNGSSGGWFPQNETVGYNAGMRGKKGSYYDGGHRVPFFIRWPAGGLVGDRQVDELCCHLDLLPTFVDLCGLQMPREVDGDGLSLARLLLDPAAHLPERTIMLQYRQDTRPPDKWDSAVMQGNWRLVYGKELYDIATDPGQTQDVAAQFPQVAARLRQAHEDWWAEVRPLLDQYCPISLGNPAENPTRLNAMDVLGDVAWNQSAVAAAMASTGTWCVDVEQPGTYRFRLCRWPDELSLPLDACISPEEGQQLAPYFGYLEPQAIQPISARLKLGDREEVRPASGGAKEVVFEWELAQTGVTHLDAWFTTAEGREQGAYYVYVERLVS
jgi:arylsulfatase A-like enzyme